MFGPIQISPSILSADFLHLEDSIDRIVEAGAEWIHVDVMDGHFVPNLTIGIPHVAALHKTYRTPLDVHLMIDNPDREIPWYIAAGADMITVHVETLDDPAKTIKTIHDAGRKCGLSLCPPTPVESILPWVGDVDMVLVMSVNPGFSGQSFMPVAIDKVAAVAEQARSIDTSPLIEVDGGISVKTAPLVVAAGADVLVAGNAIFKAENIATALRNLRASGENARVR